MNMNESVQIGPWGAIATLVGFLGTIVGLVVWLVKKNMQRQEKVTDRSFTFMEKQVDTQALIHTKHAESIQTLAEAVKGNTIELKDLRVTFLNHFDKK